MIGIYTDEMYPVFYLTDDPKDFQADIPQDFIDAYEKVNQEWHKYQNKLDEYYDEARLKKKLEDAKLGIQPTGWAALSYERGL